MDMFGYEDLTENFNTRFPGDDGFFVIRTIDNDIEPFLDIMRRQSESRKRVLDIYSQGPLPIAVIVELSGGDVVRFADSLRINGIKIEGSACTKKPVPRFCAAPAKCCERAASPAQPLIVLPAATYPRRLKAGT